MTDQAVPVQASPENIVPTGEVVPAKLQPIRRIMPFVLRYPVRLALTVLFLLVSAISSLAIPAALGGVIDKGFIEQNLDNVAGYGWLIVGIAAACLIRGVYMLGIEARAF